MFDSPGAGESTADVFEPFDIEDDATSGTPIGAFVDISESELVPPVTMRARWPRVSDAPAPTISGASKRPARSNCASRIGAAATSL